MHLAGNAALVTGVQQGIGAAMTVAFAGEGADVAINWLDDEAMADTTAAQVRRVNGGTYLV